VVRSPPFQGGRTGSNPVGGTIYWPWVRPTFFDPHGVGQSSRFIGTRGRNPPDPITCDLFISMDPHEHLIADHKRLRERAQHLQSLAGGDPSKIQEPLLEFQKIVTVHFQKEETYYRILDNDKRVADRGLVHQLRNDHAAVIFTLESLLIRLRKNGPNDDWQERFKKLMDVFLPHLDHEDKMLFPLGRELLKPEEIENISKHIQEVESR
jgi:hemerythrin superfamily protein